MLQPVAAFRARPPAGARSSNPQVRKFAVSVPSNIAEEFGRHYTPADINHLWIANGSDYELQIQLELAHRQRLLADEEATALITDAEEVTRILKGLVKSLERPSRV